MSDAAVQKPPTLYDIVRAQRDELSSRILDMEANIALLQIKLNKAEARIAELEGEHKIDSLNEPAAPESTKPNGRGVKAVLTETR